MSRPCRTFHAHQSAADSAPRLLYDRKEAAQPMTDSEAEQWIADVRASCPAGTLPKWQIRAVERIANWKWETATPLEGM